VVVADVVEAEGFVLAADIVDEDVDAAEPRQRGVDHPLDIGGVADIDRQAERRAASVDDRRHGVVDGPARARRDRDLATLLGQAQRNRAADALTATGDDGDLAGKFEIHGGLRSKTAAMMGSAASRCKCRDAYATVALVPGGAHQMSVDNTVSVRTGRTQPV